jgi:UDP:flavonoid glycosyltransferase YjiC (YdhE family)
MAQAIPPLASSAVDYENSPHVEPPPTTFPYPRDDSSSKNTTRLESDATLYERDDLNQLSDASPRPTAPVVASEAQIERPRLAPRKFETDLAHPVAPRQHAPVRAHWSALTHPIDGAADSTDDDSSSEDAMPPTFGRSHTQPENSALSKAQLNRVRTHPRGRGLTVGNEHFESSGRIARDGRLTISVNEAANSGYLAKALGATIESHLKPHHLQEEKASQQAKADFLEAKPNLLIPRLNIVIMVIGSRGDIQPFLKIGKILRDKYHHRVRIATHPTFKTFIQDEIGLEFFSVGGDPSELMAFMVKNPGLVPSLETVKAGEIGRRRESMYQMFQGFWRACINATDDETDTTNLKMMGSSVPFVADAIIANPPSFAHYHCAERLSIPLHLVFTFPYSPTQAFPHPLANIKASNVDQSYTNFMSYPLVDLMTWQGLGDLVNRFRVLTLGLEPVSTLWAPGQLSRLKVPMTYLWSPGLVPKPSDWGPEIDIAGYVFLDLASSFKPPEDLSTFLERSDDRPIIYIGFGSISGIDDAQAFTRMIFDGVAKAGVRAIISRGWGGMGDGMDKPDGVFMIDNVPHDWLFPKVDAVVHHGGAGTTAAGLRYGKPTLIIPFFGDQPFWSAMVVKAGAGAKEALPLKKLNSDKFAEGIRQCLEPDAKANAEEIAKSIEEEGDGAENAVDSFHRALDLDAMRCHVFKDRVAVWKVKHTVNQLSALAADLLVDNKQLQWSDLHLKRIREWTDFQGPGEPITGAGGVVVSAFHEAFQELCEMHETTKRDIKAYEKRRKKRKNKSVTDGLLLPGRIAYATRGTSVEIQKKQHARLQQELNLRGEAEPSKRFFVPARSKDNPERPSNLTRSTTTSSNAPPAVVTIMKDVGQGIGRSSRAIISMPLKVWNATALGFHNAPRLYGDKTVRPAPQKITGFRSGVKAAGNEFFLGIYDGVTGLVRLPYLEVHEEGISGLPKGVARGMGGFILKPISGVLGLGAYTFKGFHKSMRRRFRDTERTDRWIRRARIAQGQNEIQGLKEESGGEGAAPAFDRSKELDSVRDHALRQWTTIEQESVSESREKDNRSSKRNWQHEPNGRAQRPPRAYTR